MAWMKSVVKGVIVTTVAAGMLAGCASKQPAPSALSPTGAFQFSSDITFEDIPVPKGFRLKRKQTFAYQNDKTRVGRLVYEGRDKILDVLAFYQQQMPLHQWREISYTDYIRAIRVFEKEGQLCVITVSKSFGWHNCEIEIQVAPSRG